MAEKNTTLTSKGKFKVPWIGASRNFLLLLRRCRHRVTGLGNFTARGVIG